MTEAETDVDAEGKALSTGLNTVCFLWLFAF